MWTKVSDDHNDDPVMMALDRDARLFHLELTTWSVKHLQDGFVPTFALRRVSDSPDVEGATAQLLAGGLLEAQEGGYLLTRFAEQQMSAEDVQRTRDKWKADKVRNRLHRLGDHSMCTRGNYCPKGEVEPRGRRSTVDASTDATRASSGPTPIPSPSPTPREDEGQGGAAAPAPLRSQAPSPRRKRRAVTVTMPGSVAS